MPAPAVPLAPPTDLGEWTLTLCLHDMTKDGRNAVLAWTNARDVLAAAGHRLAGKVEKTNFGRDSDPAWALDLADPDRDHDASSERPLTVRAEVWIAPYRCKTHPFNAIVAVPGLRDLLARQGVGVAPGPGAFVPLRSRYFPGLPEAPSLRLTVANPPATA